MKLLRGLFSLLNFDAYILGICMLIVSKMVDESSLMIFGIIALILGIVGSVLATLKTPKQLKVKVAFYYFVNGSLVFLNCMIIGIPFTRMILNTMHSQGSDFIAWKEGNLKYEESSSFSDEVEVDDQCVTVPKIRKKDLSNSVETLTCDEILEKSADEIIELCCKIDNDLKKRLTYKLQRIEGITADDYLAMMEVNKLAAATAIAIDNKISANEKKLISKLFFNGDAGSEECKDFVSENMGNLDDLIDLTSSVDNFDDFDLMKQWKMFIKCVMLVDGPMNPQEEEFFDVVDY